MTSPVLHAGPRGFPVRTRPSPHAGRIAIRIELGQILTAGQRTLDQTDAQAASLHFRLEQGRLTDSRLSVLTGVHRKDVKRLREELQALEAAPRTVSPGARIIGLWTGRP